MLAGGDVGRERDGTQRDDGADEAAAGAMLLIGGEGLLTTHALTKPEVVIGRADDCDVVVPSATLSRHHVRLRLGPPLTLQDLDSRNGTHVHGKLHRGGQPVQLCVGDGFRIGRLSFLVLGSASASASSSGSELGQPLRVEDPSLAHASAHLRDIARSGANVLILGETGVGKEVLAVTLHSLSERSGPLVRINCAALAPALLESELFGHEKGAFTGASESKPGMLASAKGGTVLLDEVGELPDALQAKLLRAIETKEVQRVGAGRPLPIDVRFLAATNRDLPTEAARGRFRADLYFRLDGVSLLIPPLRERRRLISRLALELLAEAQRSAGQPPTTTLPAEVLRHLEEHDWPGNVRELKTALERALVFARGRELKPKHLGLRAARPADAPDPAASRDAAEAQERARIIEALEACAGNQTRAAQRLGISRATMTVKLALHRIPRPRK